MKTMMAKKRSEMRTSRSKCSPCCGWPTVGDVWEAPEEGATSEADPFRERSNFSRDSEGEAGKQWDTESLSIQLIYSDILYLLYDNPKPTENFRWLNYLQIYAMIAYSIFCGILVKLTLSQKGLYERIWHPLIEQKNPFFVFKKYSCFSVSVIQI